MCCPLADKDQPPLSLEEAAFFDGDPAALSLYAALRGQLLALEGESHILVQRSQISFRAPRPYAWVWHSRHAGGAKAAQPSITLTFAAPFPIDSGRIFARVEPYPGRFTHHLRLHRPSQIDQELIQWLSLSLRFRNPSGDR